MKKSLLFLSALTMLGFAYGQVDHFNVTIEPNPLKINEAADLKVTALDANGDIVKDYLGDIYIQEDETLELGKDIELPNDQMYTFTAEDQGQKVFSKGTIFKKAGDFKIIVTDIATEGDEEILGTVQVKVTEEESSIEGDITISSPAQGGEFVGDKVDVIGSSSFPNSQFQLFIDGNMVEEGITDENGDFTVGLTSLEQKEHKLQVSIIGLDNQKLAESEIVSFDAGGEEQDWFKSISIIPGNQVAQSQEVTIQVTTIETVGSVEITAGSKFIMDKDKQGQFSKKLKFDQAGSYNISLDITKDGIVKKYENKGQITVVAGQVNSIGQVSVKQLPGVQDKVTLDWLFTGTISQYQIKYGINKELFELQVNSPTNSVELTSLDPSKVYYAQVFPLNAQGVQDGNPSTVVTIEITHGAACVVQGIKLSTKEIDGKNYLVWDKAQGASKYIIYKSDNDPEGVKSNMVKVGETTELMFEYPFDLNSDKDIYSYYSVFAQCESGEMQIDEVKKVKVGPMDTFILLSLISFFLYGIYRLYGFSKEY